MIVLRGAAIHNRALAHSGAHEHPIAEVRREEMCRHESGDSHSAAAHYRYFCCSVLPPCVPMALGRGDDPVGCEVAVLPPGACACSLSGARRVAMFVSYSLCRLASDYLSAIAVVLADSFSPGHIKPRCRY